MKKPESRLQKKIRRRLEEDVGGFWRKVWGGPYQAVFLDIVGCVDGLYFELEVKLPKTRNNTSELQDETIKDVKKAGGISGVVTSPEEAVKLVLEALARAKGSGRLRNQPGFSRIILSATNRKNLHHNGRARKTRMAARSNRRAANVD